MSRAPDPQSSFLDELDARQDDLLLQLDQLSLRIEALLSQFSAPSVPPPPLNCPAQATPHLADLPTDL
jgi:hypothetical protein